MPGLAIPRTFDQQRHLDAQELSRLHPITRVNYFVTFIVIVALSGFSYLITRITFTKMIADGTERYSGVEAAIARKALQTAHGCLDNPIERAHVFRFKIVSVKIVGPAPQKQNQPP